MQPGDVVADRFEIERLAKSGGMGEVYLARDRSDGAPVAVKMLSGCSEQAETYFAREARILADLRHPAVVEYRAHGRTPTGSLWLAMEWLDGVDLEEHVRGAALTVRESLALVRRAADALGAAHERGIVHRDIKPSNLFLVEGDIERAKLLDFGIARSREATRPATRTGMLLGTPGYMAPEQTLGSKDLTPAADVFALGCVLYECLTGQAAFSGEHMMVVLAKIILGQTPRVRAVRPAVPASLDDLVASMLAKDPTERPKDGKHVAAAIRAIEATVQGDVDRLVEADTFTGDDRAVPSRADTIPAGPPDAPSTFVGRERELEILTAVYGDCVWSPRARAAIITAPPGYGKSRIVRELLARIREHDQPADIWTSRGDAMSKGSPFGMLARLVRGAAGIEGGESPEAQARSLASASPAPSPPTTPSASPASLARSRASGSPPRRASPSSPPRRTPASWARRSAAPSRSGSPPRPPSAPSSSSSKTSTTATSPPSISSRPPERTSPTARSSSSRQAAPRSPASPPSSASAPSPLSSSALSPPTPPSSLSARPSQAPRPPASPSPISSASPKEMPFISKS
ncbi:MAG: protein kinase [Polyangiaceae bacterium]